MIHEALGCLFLTLGVSQGVACSLMMLKGYKPHPVQIGIMIAGAAGFLTLQMLT